MPHTHAGLLPFGYNLYPRNINRYMGDLRETSNNKNVILGMASPTATNSLKGMEGRYQVPRTGKNSYSSPRRMDQGASSNARMELQRRG
jgi:hypothetical protein